jgi:hypothetical protein
MSRFLKAAIVVIALVVGQTVVGVSVAQAAANPTFKVTATFKSSNGKTLLWLSKTGRVIATKALTSNSQAVSLSSSGKVSRANVNGSTLQLVTSSGGDYYGPVVLGWKKSTQVYTQMNFSTSLTSIAFGTITKSTVTSKQGYAKVSTKSTKVITTTKATVKATSYKPKGVGTYGKLNLTSSPSSFHPMSGATIRAFDVNVTDTELKYTGADADADGLPNFADVNDDGDAKTDATDMNTPSMQGGGGIPAASCEAGASFNIFTNFKSTSPAFEGNINKYGPGNFEATSEKINQALTSTLTMVLSPIAQVCGSNVVTTEFKGVGVPYAPTSFVDITGTTGGTGDYQWQIGAGRIGSTTLAGLDLNGDEIGAFNFTSPTQISGQDTFIQRVTTADGKTYEFSSTAGFVFVTHPLPVRYKIHEGDDWTSFFNAERTAATYNRVSTGGDVWFEILRPQRLAVEGEKDANNVQATFMDLGGMRYTPDIPNAMNGTNVGKCDSQVTTDTVSMPADTAVVSESYPSLVIHWNLATCLTSRGGTWAAGPTFDVDIQVEPVGKGGNSAQKIAFVME